MVSVCDGPLSELAGVDHGQLATFNCQLSTFVADEIIMHSGVTIVFRSNVDLFFCVVGAQNENEVCGVVASLYGAGHKEQSIWQSCNDWVLSSE